MEPLCHPEQAKRIMALCANHPDAVPPSPCDRFLTEFDRALDTIFARPPVSPPPDDTLGAEEKRRVARLLRVDDAGEVAAQALYRGQAFFARRPELAARLQNAGAEEEAHLLGCRSRLRALGGRPSLLGPLWYAGGWLSGAFFALLGDRASLGYIDETERQVARHLSGHLTRLPAADTASRALLERMRAEEEGHAAWARAAGARPLPPPVRRLMTAAARVMTTLAARL